MKRLISSVAGLALALAVAGCGNGGTGTPTTPTTAGFNPPATAAPAAPPATAAPAAPPATAAPAAPVRELPSPTATTSGWTTGAVTVRHAVAVPPVPTLVGIRTARHPAEGFDRTVFDVSGALPGYQLRYVARPVADGTGRPFAMPGRRFLQIRFEPLAAHDEAGTPTVTRTGTPGCPMLRGYVVTGDFEGVVTVVLVLSDTAAYRAGELPGRIYVDVAT
ncbi:hypothetical protein ACFFWC_09095 [Plantactinospora siamensis]|uniref:AMIN-like domain-containing protein n=1 Tax=Plantactinospora siamensis TaxID=555372 RepID=A0ABV6P4D2_9ACTN